MMQIIFTAVIHHFGTQKEFPSLDTYMRYETYPYFCLDFQTISHAELDSAYGSLKKPLKSGVESILIRKAYTITAPIHLPF
jgi:hypothetical protein